MEPTPEAPDDMSPNTPPDAPEIARRIESHLWLVTAIGRRYRRDWIEWADIKGAGTLGLVVAANRCPAGSENFTAYAAKFIRGHVVAAVFRERTILSVPGKEWKLGHRPGETPDDSPESRRFREEVSRANERALACRAGPTHDQLSGIAGTSGGTDAVDAADEVDKMLAACTSRERGIVARRYGLGGGVEMTTPEIGREIGCGFRRAGTLLRVALGKMRAKGEDGEVGEGGDRDSRGHGAGLSGGLGRSPVHPRSDGRTPIVGNAPLLRSIAAKVAQGVPRGVIARELGLPRRSMVRAMREVRRLGLSG